MQKIRKAIIPVAGMGTRFLPATKSVPKEMLPIVDIPTIDYIVKEAINSGIEEILFITSPYKKAVEDYFDHFYELEQRLQKSGKNHLLEKIMPPQNVSFSFIRQGEPLGTGHAIKLAKSFVSGEPFAVLYGDDIFLSEKPCLQQLIDVYEQYDCNVFGGLYLTDEEIPRKGILSFQDDSSLKVAGVVEKPSLTEAPSHFGTVGRYILKPEIFQELEKIDLVKGEYLLTDAMDLLMQYQDFYAAKIEGKYFDIGLPIGYVKANIAFALQKDEMEEDLRKYLSTI